jgi:polyphenol oxidase
MSPAPSALRHSLLAACGVSHGFGVRTATAPHELLRPRQVHGSDVAELDAQGRLQPEQADAVVSTQPGLSIGVVTADCVPILAASANGAAVAAIHAGWRGLAAGVVAAGITRLRARAAQGSRLVAVVGPHIGACCYEVDAPVRAALGERFGERLEGALAPSRPGHWQLALARLVELELRDQGLGQGDIARIPDACTHCDPHRFHSYRRDREAAGRLVHHIAAAREGPSLTA